MFKYFLLFILAVVSLSAYSQGFPDDGEPCGPPFGDPCPVPIDGGVGFLIAAGLAYGGKKYRDQKKQK